MPINSKIKSLYDALKADGADVGSEQEFSDWFQAPGEQGYNNRKYVYDTFKADGADVGKNYEEFAGWLGLHAVQPQVAQAGAERQHGEPEPQQGGQQTGQVTPREVVASQATDKQVAQGGFGGGQMGGGGANRSWGEVTNATPTPTPVIEPQQPTDVKQKIQPAELTEKEVGDDLAFMREANKSRGDILEAAPQAQSNNGYSTPKMDKAWKLGYSQSWGKIKGLFDGLDYGKKDVTVDLDNAVKSRYDSMSDQAIESELQKLSKEYKAGQWEGGEEALRARISRLQFNLVAHEYGFKDFKDLLSRRGEAEFEMYKYHPAFEQEWLATYKGGPGENPLLNWGKEIVKKQLIEDTMNGVNRPAGYYHSLPFSNEEFSKRYASWALKRSKALGNMGFADVYNNGIKTWESYIGAGLLESGAEEAMAQGTGYRDVGIAGGKYNSDFDAAAATAWNMAEDEYRRLSGAHSNEIWGDYASMGGGREARMVASGEWAVSNMADRLSSHDLDKMIDNAWKSLGESKQKQIVLAAAQNLKQQYPGMSPAEMVKTAQSMVRQQTIQRVLDYAKEQNAPKNVVDYFTRKVLEQNSIFKIQEAMARSRAGTSGDWQARDMAMQEYGKNHRVAGVTGTVVGMGLDPVTYISAGVGKGAAAGTVKLIEKLGGAAGRKWLTTTAGKVVVGAAGGAANLGTFEGLNETLNQLRWGGSPAVDLKTGLIKTTGYDAGKVGKAIFHGTTMGAGTGIVAPLVGNVWSPFMEATSSTAGKIAVKTGELFTGTIAEGTIFSIPDVYNAYTESENIIKSFSDKKSRNYISDEQERAKAIAKVREQRNETMLDAWSESVATMAGFKMKHVGQRLYELSQSGNGHAGFETRLRYMLDRKPDLALTKDEQAELERGGYTDLKELVNEYVKAEKNRRANSKPVVTGRPRTMELGTREEDMPYNRFVDLMNDGSISEAARAKMYYYITGHALPMSTVMYGQLTENKDRDGNVKGYTVQSIGANGVVTSREFTSRKRAENELQKVNRQIELNTIDIGERYDESIGNSTKELREDIGQKYGVDVEKALKKEPKRRSTGEQMALDEYMRRLFPEKEAREEDAEDVTFSDDADVPNETTNGFTDEPTDEGDAIVVETLSRTGEDGMVHPAVLKGEDESQVNIVSGNVVTLADGTIDVANSDQDIIIVDAKGQRLMININDIASIGTPIDPNAAMAAAEQVDTEPADAGTTQTSPTQPTTQEGATGIDVGGRYQVADGEGTHEIEVLRDNGNGTLEVRVDGEQHTMPLDILQQMLGIDVALSTPQTGPAAANQQQGTVAQSGPVATNDMAEADVPETGSERYSVDPNADERAMGMAGFSEQDIAATVDYLNGKLGDREYLETVGISADTLDATSDEQIASWVNSIVERASEFITDEAVESGEVMVESDEDEQSSGRADEVDVLPPTPSNVEVEPEEDIEAMPMLDDGNPDYSQVDASRAHDYLYSDESGLDKSEADEYVQAQIDAAEKALSKINKRPLEMGTDLAKYRAEKQHRQEQLDAAKANVDYWERVKAIEADREAQAAAERKVKDAEVAAQAQAEEQARQAAELAKQQEQVERGAGAVHPAIAEKWNNAPKVEGYKDEVVLANGERVPGTYYLVESGAVTPSHNASREFEKYEGFPVDENGNTINDRDYERDKDAQNITRSIADKYDSRALQTPVIVSKDGVVLSGNGRTMAGELAASNNTDGAYIEHLKNYGRKYGFSPEQVSSMQHPRAVFVPDADMPYTTETFAKFNAQEMKGQSKTEQAVKLGKVVDDATFNQVVRAINEHETLGDFYGDTKAATEAINALRRAGAINDMQYAEMFDGDAVSDRGRQIIENMLIGKAFDGNPDVIRQLTEIKSLRQSVVTALNEITTNKALGKEYSLEKELAQAVDLAYKARKAGYKENEPVSPYATQLNLSPFEDGETVADYNNVAVLELADLMNDKRPTQLKKKLQDYNQQSAESAAGQMDIFAGGVKEKKEIIKTVLNTLHNGETEETSRPEQRGPVADERGREASLQENGAADESDQSAIDNRIEEIVGLMEIYASLGTKDIAAKLNETGYQKAEIEEAEKLFKERHPDGVEEISEEDAKEILDNIEKQEASLTTPQTEPSIDAAIVEAGKETNTEPTDAQKEAGNYKKGHVKIDGFDVSIEQPKGSVRSGVDATGKAWSQKMNNTYGYIRGTEGVDGDHIDVFLSDDIDGWNGTVYVIDQVEKGGVFDEHKVMYGFNSEEDARKAYLSNYEDGWDGLGAITAVSKDEFKKWIDSSHRKTKPFAEYKNVKVGETQEQEPKQQGTLFPATEQQPSSKSETKPRTTEKQPAEAPKERIDDVGEKIEGAKKDLAKKMGERINLDADTFPKMFPKYDLKKLISQGLDPNLAVMTKMLRQMAQADYKHYSKKRMYGKSYALRAARFYAAYAKQVLEAGDSNVDFKSEGLGFTDYGKQFVELNKRLFEELYNKLGDDLFDLDLAGVKIQPLSQKEGSTWFRRNQETGEMEPYNPAYAFVGPRGQNYYEANELDKALQEGVEQVTKSIDYKKAHPYKLGHYYKPGIKNSDYVGVKLGGKIVPLTEPMTSSEVRKYMSEHNAELQAKAAQLDEQRKLDKKKGGTGEGRWKPELTLGGGRPRVGVDRRGGVDVEPEEFRKAFSFRGVQFGNYVTQRERQRFLNEAYDALMDMAELLGISPRAIAIDGRLGFAIGARGGGKANAHYEPKENVINLTKSKGAGSLAHEWFHALDYYFNRGDKKPTASTANKSAEQFPASTRNEMRKAFLDLMSAIKNSDYFKRSENLEMKLRSGKLDEGYYDKPTELAARAFQDYVVRKLADQGKINDFLSSFTSEEEWNGEPENYPFPIGAEAEKIDEKFDALFDAMQERTDEEGNTILYHLGKDHDVLTDTEIALRDGLVGVMRSVGIDVETDEVKGQKVLDNAIQANATLQEMRGWHGSAAEFDEFDHSHMSEGEGNQAIGYGTYIASIEEIGRYYGTVAAMQKRFRAAPGYGDYDHYWKGQKIDLSSINPLRMAYDIVQREGTIKKAIAMVEKFVDNPEAHEGWRSALDILRESRKSDFKRKRANYEGERYLYEVDIPENDGTNYLPWDEPLSDAMRERIAQGLRDMGVDLNEPFERRSGKADNFDFLDEQMSEHPITGQELYYKLVDRFGRYPQQASEFLNKYCGLVGIEYPSNFFSGGNKKGLKNHVIFNEKDIKIDNRTQYFISADGVVYGFVKDGKIYIDPKIATAETPIHEYCHLWGDALKEANPEAWERLKETMLGEKDVMDYVKKMYPGLEGDALVSEVFSHYSGRRGAERLRADMEREVKNAEGVFAKARVARIFDIIKRALSRFWTIARDLFAGKTRGLDRLTAEDFADMAMSDLLRGFNPRKNVSGETFYSNAERAVENIKQNKATVEQWKAMLTKAGGLKAGEDKWMGLSQWLEDNKGKSLTKEEVLQFVRDNGIQMEEVEYVEANTPEEELRREALGDIYEYGRTVESTLEHYKEKEKDEEKFIARLEKEGRTGLAESTKESLEKLRKKIRILESADPNDPESIRPPYEANGTRLEYTTDGLRNYREIAFKVPNVESYQEHDEVHFGPENEGRAVMWVRFGETTDADGNRVLVIDEIQSNRHQDAREKGYRQNEKKARELRKRKAEAAEQSRNIVDGVEQRFLNEGGNRIEFVINGWEKYATDAEIAEYRRLTQLVNRLSEEQTDVEPFYNKDEAERIPSAPFEKNWHEVAMKRMLRLAAEEGFDKVAWTTGEQQAKRYNLGRMYDSIEREDNPSIDGKRFVLSGRNMDTFVVNKEGNIEDSSFSEFNGKPLSDVVGKDLAERMMNLEDGDMLEGEDLRIGGEGMKGFYDQMLPRFMDKYGKKWGVKTGTVELPNVEEAGRTMHSVDVTPAMRASVMSGQPMFQKAAPNDNFEDVPGVNKEHDEYVSIKEVEDYLDSLPNAYNVHGVTKAHPINSLESLEALKPILDQELYDEIKKRIYHPNVYGCRDSETGMIFVFTHKIWTLNHAEHNWWHENTHGAYDALELADKEECGKEALDWLLRHGHVTQEQVDHYEDAQRGSEGAARLIAYIFDNYGVDGILNKKFDGNEKIAKLATAIQNYYKYGETREEESRNRLRQTSSSSDGRDAENGIDASGRDRQGAIQSEKGSRAGEEIGRPERGSSIIDEVAEDGVGYGEADDSGISDEELAGYDAGRYSFAENITQGLVDLAMKNASDQQLRLNAMREFGGNLAKLRKIMNKQKAYDKGTVDDIVRLARMVMGSGFFKDMSAYEVKRLLAAIKKGVGAEDLTPIANNVVDMLVQHQLRESKNMLHKLMQVRGRKVDARGVEVQAGLDIDGQRMMSALKDGMSLGENGLLTRINDCENRLGSEDEVIRKNAMSEYQGLMLAKEYHDNILSGEEEEIVLRNEKRQEQEKIYDFRREPVLDDDGNAIINQDGSVRTVERKTLKPQFKNNVTDENKQLRRNTEAAIERIEQSIRESRMERVTSYIDFMSDVAGDVRASRERAAAWRDEQLKRVEEIHHNANSDLQGIDPKSQTKEKKFVPIFNPKNDLVRGLFMPLATFEKFMRFFGRRFHNGEGYLFDRYVRGMIDCSDKEWRSKRAAHDELDAKVTELFGKTKLGAKRHWSDLFELERKKKYPTIPVEYWDNGERVRESLSQGEALSLYVWGKQKDAEAGLRRMGISEEDMETLKGQLDPKFVELADWVVSDFLPKRREYYNEVYERMFGAPMAAIENYFPIVRNSRDVEKPTDVTERDMSTANASTITGSFIKRVRTAAALDIHTDFFSHLLKHLDDMEHIAAWAEFNRDLNTLRNYKRFKNRVSNMNSFEFGAGKDLWKAFDNCCAIVAGVYEGNAKSKLDKITLNINKGFTGGAIAFRFNTALKQLLSLPAFWSDASADQLLLYQTNPVGNFIAWKWAMQNLPGFSKRWQSRQVGDTRLMDTDMDWKLWRNKYMKYINRGGMLANAFVDAVTVASGAKAVYETKKRRYKNIGYTDEQAERKALQDAAISYNGSQQSSESGFVSEMQVDRTFLNNMLTIFRNSPFSYGRKMTTGFRELKKRLRPGYKSDFIEAEAKKMEREGIPEDNAKKAARRLYRFGGLHAMFDVFNYGYLLSFLWTVLGGSAWYLLFGKDDEKKKEIIKDGTRRLWFSPLEGFTGGNTLSEKGGLLLKYASDEDGAEKALEDFVNWSWFTTPMEGETDNFLRDVRFDEQKAMWDVLSLAIQANLGFKPETFTDGVAAIVDYCDGDPQTSKEFLLCFMRVMQVPQSQTDNVYIDELGMTAKDAQKLNAMEMADRYAKYKRRKNDPLSYITHSDDEQNIYEKYRKRFLDNMKERMMKMDEEQLNWNFDNPNDSERRKAVGKAYAKGKGVQDSAGKKPASNWKPETRRSQLKYQRLRDWTDLAEDVLLDTAIDQAKNRGDDERLKALQDAKKELTEIKRGKHTETWDIDGLGDGSAEDDKAIMDELRARRKELLRELGVI